MNPFSAAFGVEVLKARRARAQWLIGMSFMLAPIMGGLFMFILKDPEQARAWGLIRTKAQFAGSVADWPTFLGLLAQAVAVGGALVFSLMTAWIFGREFADRTAREILALPTPRSAIISAKFVVVLTWTALVTCLVMLLGVVVGHVVSLPGWSLEQLLSGMGTVALAATLTIALMPVVAFVASIGRGYFPAIGWTMLAVFLAQVVAVMGWGAFFPWSVPALASGAAGPEGARLGVESYLLVGFVSVSGTLATFGWWQWADHTE